MSITVHMSLPAFRIGSVVLVALGYVAGRLRTRVTRRKRRS